MTSAGRVLIAVGVAALLLGAVLGFSSVSVVALNGSQDCGSAFSHSNYADVAGSVIVGECDSKLQDRRTEAIAALLAGAVLALFGAWQIGWPPVVVAGEKIGLYRRTIGDADDDSPAARST